TQAFTATVTNDSANQGVTWSLTGAGCTAAACGSVAPTTSPSGTPVTYTAPGAVPTPPTVTLTATSGADGTKSAAATITLSAATGAAIAVALTPLRGGLVIGQSLGFTATVTNDTGNQGVTWSAGGASCTGTACGSFSAQAATTATYVAPGAAGS